MIKTIYLANILEGFYRHYQLLPVKARIFQSRYDALEGNRSLLYGQDNKVILTSYPIQPNHFNHFCQLMGWKKVFNLFPSHPSSSLCEDVLNDKKLNHQVEEIIKKNQGVSLIPYRQTPEFYSLIKNFAEKKLSFTNARAASTPLAAMTKPPLTHGGSFRAALTRIIHDMHKENK